VSFSAILRDPKERARIGGLPPSKAVTEGALGTLSYLNGLATAVIVGPEAVPAAEWIGCFLEGSDGASEEVDSLLATVALIEHGKIVESLGSHGSYEPHFWEDGDGNLVTRDWAEGFFTGIRLRNEAWKPYLEGKGRVLTAILCVLLQDKEIEGQIIEQGEDPKRLFESAQVKIIEFIQALYSIRREEALDTQTQDGKIGRNDPCPCGSGKKYKKCCLN
jgi:uncharacterized protein